MYKFQRNYGNDGFGESVKMKKYAYEHGLVLKYISLHRRGKCLQLIWGKGIRNFRKSSRLLFVKFECVLNDILLRKLKQPLKKVRLTGTLSSQSLDQFWWQPRPKSCMGVKKNIKIHNHEGDMNNPDKHLNPSCL